MKLLAIEAVQTSEYYRHRYGQVEGYDAEIYVLNGLGSPDFWPAERYRVAGSKHVDDIVAAARAWHEEERFDGVLTFSEAAVVLVAIIARELGLPGIDVEAARTSRNKLLMRQAHERHGVPHPRFRYVTDLDAALAAAGELGYPVILKPTLGAGSYSVYRINRPEDLQLRFPQALEARIQIPWFRMQPDGIDFGPDGLLIESFLEGPEFMTESLAWDDEVYIGSIVDRVTVEGETFDDDVHRAPTALDADQVAAIHRVIKAAAHAQGLHRSAMHAEVRYHGGEPHILEIAARPGGAGLDYFARVSAGYCPIRAVRDLAAGVRPDVHHYRPTGVHAAGACLFTDPGRIDEIVVPESVATSDRVFYLRMMMKPGDVVLRPPHGNSVLGFLCTTGSSFEDAMGIACELADQIQVRLSDPDAGPAGPGAPAPPGTRGELRPVLLTSVPELATATAKP
ncbi:MAG: ATP-grasp domain-containing protein [Frankiaceae bacterium]